MMMMCSKYAKVRNIMEVWGAFSTRKVFDIVTVGICSVVVSGAAGVGVAHDVYVLQNTWIIV